MDRDLLIADLKLNHGPLLGPADIASLLDFKSHDSCMRALRSGTLDVPTFRIRGRPGYFALTEDFADWLLAAKSIAARRYSASALRPAEERPMD